MHPLSPGGGENRPVGGKCPTGDGAGLGAKAQALGAGDGAPVGEGASGAAGDQRFAVGGKKPAFRPPRRVLSSVQFLSPSPSRPSDFDSGSRT